MSDAEGIKSSAAGTRGGSSSAAGGLSIALAGGGTGGHVVPGRHLLDHWIRSGAALTDVLWFGAGRPIESRVLAGLTDALGRVPFAKVDLGLEPPGGGAPSLSRLALRTLPAVWDARRALARHETRVVLGLGGYTSLPVVLAARTLGIPVALLEINAVAGRATRTMERFAARVFHAWTSTLPAGSGGAQAPGARHLHIGPPLAAAFAAGEPAPEEQRSARAALGFDPEAPLVLVLGGSQGALSLNRFVQAHGGVFADAGVSLLHQCGPGRTTEGAGAVGSVRSVEYLDDVATALAAATLVLSRGGASTLAEIAARRRPAWIVPYPHHPDRHQERNARLLGEGVRLVGEDRLDGALAAELVQLAGEAGHEARARMADALAGVVPLDAAPRLASALEELSRID